MLEPISNKEYEIKEERMKNKLIVDLCKKVIKEGEDFTCEGIRCYEGCPFNNEELDVCDLEYEDRRVNVAEKYLNNDIELPKQEAETYRGWEIIKMCEEGEFENSTILQDENDNCFTIINGVILDGEQTEFNSEYETASSFFIHNKFTVIERKKFDFDEALESLKDGNSITSVKTGYSYKLRNGVFCYYDDVTDHWLNCRGFDYEEVINKWYIYK